MKNELSADVQLIDGGKGIFDVKIVDTGELVFSKHKVGRFPDPGEVVGLLKEKGW